MQSIDRAISILNLLSRHEEGLPISEISEQLQLPLGSTHRFLQSLQENKMIVQNPVTKYYLLGVHVLYLATNLLNSNRLLPLSKPHMAKLATTQKKLVYLCVEQDGDVICVDFAAAHAEANTRFYVQIGSKMPLHASAPAKIILAHYPREVAERLLEQHAPLLRYTTKTKCETGEILAEYEQCRQLGYAVCDEEMENSVYAVAAPVFDYSRQPIGSVAVISLKMDRELFSQMTKNVIACAKDISREMGYNPPLSRDGLSPE